MPKRRDRQTAKGAQGSAAKPLGASGSAKAGLDEADRIASAFLDNRQMEETRSYVSRGRRFEAASVDDLNQAWASLFRALVDGDQSQVRDLEDIGAEIRLRGLAEPAHMVAVELATAADMIRRDGPASLSESGRNEIRTFLGELEKPKAKN